MYSHGLFLYPYLLQCSHAIHNTRLPRSINATPLSHGVLKTHTPHIWFTAFDNFHGVNTLTLVVFKLPVRCLKWSWKEKHILALSVVLAGSSSPPFCHLKCFCSFCRISAFVICSGKPSQIPPGWLRTGFNQHLPLSPPVMFLSASSSGPAALSAAPSTACTPASVYGMSVWTWGLSLHLCSDLPPGAQLINSKLLTVLLQLLPYLLVGYWADGGSFTCFSLRSYYLPSFCSM